MRVAIYARYSSDRQNERSIDDQITVCRRHAEARGWTVTATFSDAALSGAAMANRPGVLALVAAAETGAFDLVLVEDEDRLARNLEHLAHVASRLDFARVRLATLSTDHVEELHVAFKGLQASQYIKNLSQKTKRGMVSNAEKGLATGSRIYGYRSAPGGQMEIVEDQAEVVRRVAALYAEGLTPRAIANRLNAEAIPSPRGGLWNANVIGGHRMRGTGILRCDIYAGVKLWNRLEVRRDPRTGKRLSRARPESEWKRTPVPHLRIIDEETWKAIKARQASEAGHRPETLVRKRGGVFSGLLKCGVCGASYTAYTGGRLICAAHREKGDSVCANSRTVARAEVEERVLEGLRTRMLSPEAVAAYVRIYHAEWDAAQREAKANRRPMEKRVGELARSIERAVDAICAGTATSALQARLKAMEAEKADLETRLADDAGASLPVVLHPKAAEAHIARIERLRERLGSVCGTDEAPELEAVRGLVERIDIIPKTQERGGPIDLLLHGSLAWALASDPERSGYERMGAMVAGARYPRSHTTVAIPIRLSLRACP